MCIVIIVCSIITVCVIVIIKIRGTEELRIFSSNWPLLVFGFQMFRLVWKLLQNSDRSRERGGVID